MRLLSFQAVTGFGSATEEYTIAYNYYIRLYLHIIFNLHNDGNEYYNNDCEEILTFRELNNKWRTEQNEKGIS